MTRNFASLIIDEYYLSFAAGMSTRFAICGCIVTKWVWCQMTGISGNITVKTREGNRVSIGADLGGDGFMNMHTKEKASVD